jgi:predicted nucleotidyltransferase
LRVYKNQSAVANTAPSAPTTLTAAWAYNASGISTATFKWNPAVDNGSSATPANVLTYQVEISSSSGFTGKSLVADPHGSSPGMGNYLKPPLIFDGLTTHGVMLYSLPLTNTTFYYRVKTIDAGLKESAWSSTGSLYTSVPSSAPSAVADLSAGQFGDGQITLKWTEPLNINSAGNAQYDVRYSTTAAIANDMDFTNATSLSGEPTPGIPGNATSMSLLNLTPMVTYYFGLKSSNDNGTSALDVITPRPNAVASPFDATQIEVDGLRGGLYQGGAAWGDFDNDGDMDVLASGYDGSARQLRVYKNNGNGTIDPSQIEVEALNGGFNASMVAWGDFDNDGDLDILVDGDDSTGKQLRIYKNNANGTFNATQIEVESLNGGLIDGGVAWGDFDNDGDLDISLNGYDGSNSQLRVYKNNGNGTVDPTQIEVDGLNGGLRIGTVAWGDFDKDGDLDILTNGSTGSNQLRVYKNQGDGTFDTTQIEVDGLNGGMQAGGSTWGDFDNDGDMDILIAGWDGSNSQLRIYKNKNDGTFDTTQIEVDGVNNGLRYSSVAWGDHDNDGDLDILVSGYDGANNQLRIYRNNANGTIHPTQIEVDGLGGGLRNCSVAWGDYDNDRDLDILVLGYDGYYQLRIYKNQFEAFQTNTLPTAPSSFSSGFSFTSSSVSVASMTWSAGSDSGTGSTPENVLTYDVQISTTSNFGTLMFPGQLGATPRMGSYLKPPKIFNSNTDYGVVLKSTDPWNVHTTASYGLRTDTTYYYRVKTMDSALAESAWSSSTGTLNTGVSPSTSTLAATAGTSQVSLSWNSAGDDGSLGNLTGQYRIQYATYTATWSTSSTPTGCHHRHDRHHHAIVPGSAQGYTATSLTNDTYYFVLWSGGRSPQLVGRVQHRVGHPAVPRDRDPGGSGGPTGLDRPGGDTTDLGDSAGGVGSVSGVTVSSVAVQTGVIRRTAILTNVEVWVSSSGYIDANAIRLENTAKAFSSDAAVFTQDVVVSTTPLYFIARSDVSGSATEGTFDISLQVYTTALTVNNPIAFRTPRTWWRRPAGPLRGSPPPPPAILLQVNLSWGGATGADSYSIYRATHSRRDNHRLFVGHHQRH